MHKERIAILETPLVLKVNPNKAAAMWMLQAQFRLPGVAFPCS
jgi:hypothetical protein